ncbi:hypothetical protein [Alistipes indistinctus]|uniref:hypothetical protein n=1 Tax=Alistipes indistinctus TaxID=626932 RepID=UPI0036F41EB9
MTIISCGGSGGSGKGKSVDVPGYAIGTESYFKNRETKGSHAFCGKDFVNNGHKKFGSYRSAQLTGTLVETDEGDLFVMLQDGGSLSLGKYLFEQSYDYSVQLLWHEYTKDNPINATLAASDLRERGFVLIENNYCDSYYIFKDEQFAEAKAWMETLEKQPNQQSEYDPKAVGGVKTYKAKIGKAVEYFGVDDLKTDRFLSLYLDCGAVVELRSKKFYASQEVVGKSIDCVTDAQNKVIEYKLN